MTEKKTPYCIAPFVHMYIHSSEQPRVCCIAEDWKANTVTNEKLNLEEIWKSDYYVNIRKEMLKGEPLEFCGKCVSNEKYSDTSDRLHFEREFQRLDIEFNVETGNQFGSPINLDLRPGNLCNLKCRMCGPASSSQLNKEYATSEIMVKPHWITFDESKLSSWNTKENIDFLLKAYDPSVQIKFLGGEPTIMPEVHSIMDALIERGMTDAKLHITTNCTNDNKTFVSKLEQFKNIAFNYSCDGIGDVLEYIRYPVNSDKLVKVIRKYSSFSTNNHISFTLQAYNLHHLPDFLEWLADFNETQPQDKQVYFSMEKLRFPDWARVETMPLEYRYKYIKKTLSSSGFKRQPEYIQERINQRLQLCVEPGISGNYRKFLMSTKVYDLTRKHHIKDYIPELWEVIKEDYNALQLSGYQSDPFRDNGEVPGYLSDVRQEPERRG